VDAVLDQIDAVDGTLHAFCTVVADEARADAERIDRRIAAGEEVGPLAGVPVGIKDLVATKGIRTACGSAASMARQSRAAACRRPCAISNIRARTLRSD